VGGIRFVLDLQRKAGVPERGLYTYVEQNKAPGEVYLTPIKMQDFRLETLAPAYVDFKSIPYKDVDVLEWYRRNQAANRFYKSPDCDLLPEMVAEGVTHVVTPSRQELPACPDWAPVYSDRYYDVYRHDNP
jgi:hypothetical protein